MSDDRTLVSLEEELAEAAGYVNAQHARMVDVAVRAITEGVLDDGPHALTRWLKLQLGVSRGRAQQLGRIARRIGEFPKLAELFRGGELSIDQVEVVATRAPAWADERVSTLARNLTVYQLRRVVRDEFFEPDPDEPAPEPDTREPREKVSTRWDEHGRYHLHATDLDADRGMVIEAALAEARDARIRDGDDDVTAADALTDMAQRSLSTATPDRRENFKCYLHLRTDRDFAQQTSGAPVPDAMRDYLLCDGVIQPVWERDNVPVGVGRAQRIVPLRLRRLVEYRDQGCRVPGCGAHRVEIHHIIHWGSGDGPTESWNLVSVCKHHHRQHHQGLLGITGNADEADGLVFTDRHGRSIGPRPATPPNGPPPPPAVGYRHPCGERLDMDWIGFSHPNAVRRRAEIVREHSERRRALERERRERGESPRDPLTGRPWPWP